MTSTASDAITDERYDAFMRAVEAASACTARSRSPRRRASCRRRWSIGSSSRRRRCWRSCFANATTCGPPTPSSRRRSGSRSGETRPTFVQVDFGLVRDDGRARRPPRRAAGVSVALRVSDAARRSEPRALRTSPALTPFLGGLDRATSTSTPCGRAIVGDHDPAEVVLMEIDPVHQKTRPDFAVTERSGASARSICRERGARGPARSSTDATAGARRSRASTTASFPTSSSARALSLPVRLPRRPRRRVDGRTGLVSSASASSRFPGCEHPWVPRTFYLHEVPSPPGDREHWLLKPLFSFAGGGIIFAPTDAQLDGDSGRRDAATTSCRSGCASRR